MDTAWTSILAGAVADGVVGGLPQAGQEVEALFGDAHAAGEGVVDGGGEAGGRGDLGQPPGGFPPGIVKKVLKGEAPESA